MGDRRVVVTGVGLVSALGIGTQATWEAVCAGRSGITAITRFDASEFSTRIAGEVKGFAPLDFIQKKDIKKMDVFIQYAIAASEFALRDAGLKTELTTGKPFPPRRTGGRGAEGHGGTGHVGTGARI